MEHIADNFYKPEDREEIGREVRVTREDTGEVTTYIIKQPSVAVGEWSQCFDKPIKGTPPSDDMWSFMSNEAGVYDITIDLKTGLITSIQLVTEEVDRKALGLPASCVDELWNDMQCENTDAWTNSVDVDDWMEHFVEVIENFDDPVEILDWVAMAFHRLSLNVGIEAYDEGYENGVEDTMIAHGIPVAQLEQTQAPDNEFNEAIVGYDPSIHGDEIPYEG